MAKNQAEMVLASLEVIDKEIEYNRTQIEELLKKIGNLEKRKENIINSISEITNPQYKKLLYLRFVKGMKWEAIAEEMHYAIQHIHRMRKEAIKEFEKKI